MTNLSRINQRAKPQKDKWIQNGTKITLLLFLISIQAVGVFPFNTGARTHNTHKAILQHIFKVTPKKGAKLLKLEIFKFPLSIPKKKKKKKEIAGEQEVHYESPDAIAIDQVHDPLLPIIYSEDFIAL